MAPVWHEPAERVCVAFVGYPSTWMTSPPGVRTHAPRDPARTTSGARSVAPRLLHSAFIESSNPPPTVIDRESSTNTPSRSASVRAS